MMKLFYSCIFLLLVCSLLHTWATPLPDFSWFPLSAAGSDVSDCLVCPDDALCAVLLPSSSPSDCAPADCPPATCFFSASALLPADSSAFFPFDFEIPRSYEYANVTLFANPLCAPDASQNLTLEVAGCPTLGLLETEQLDCSCANCVAAYSAILPKSCIDLLQSGGRNISIHSSSPVVFSALLVSVFYPLEVPLRLVAVDPPSSNLYLHDYIITLTFNDTIAPSNYYFCVFTGATELPVFSSARILNEFAVQCYAPYVTTVQTASVSFTPNNISFTNALSLYFGRMFYFFLFFY